MSDGDPAEPRWWAIRPAQNLDAKTYRCPFCGEFLPSLSAHVLVLPEGDTSRRRHAHQECVTSARREGRLPSHDEWKAAQPRRSVGSGSRSRQWQSWPRWKWGQERFRENLPCPHFHSVERRGELLPVPFAAGAEERIAVGRIAAGGLAEDFTTKAQRRHKDTPRATGKFFMIQLVFSVALCATFVSLW